MGLSLGEKYSTASKEQLLEVLQQTISAQSGVDKRNRELIQEKENLESELGELRTLNRKGNEDVRGIAEKLKIKEHELSLKERGIQYAIDNGVSAEIGAMLAMKDTQTTESNIDKIIAEIDGKATERTESEIKVRFKDAKPPQSGESDGIPRSYEELLAKDERWLENRPNLVNKLMDKFVARDNRRYQ